MVKLNQKAMKRWNEIPDDIKSQLLSNVYCSKCNDTVKIVHFEANIINNDLILKGKCAVCDNNVARLIESTEDSIDYYDEPELTFEQVDKLLDAQIESNNILIYKFEKYLESQNLVKKTIKKHCDNIDFYINNFLLHDEIEKPEDNVNSINMYFDYFMPRKTTFGSVNDTKNQIASLKKFYKYLLELNRISKSDYNELLQIIKNNKEDWFTVYDDEFIDDDW
jgi:hypothetical protein